MLVIYREKGGLGDSGTGRPGDWETGVKAKAKTEAKSRKRQCGSVL
jgi:hypothetical protein